jgi:AcrR family transcriptional regulator
LSTARASQPKRETFRHGNLPDALLEATLNRIAMHGASSIKLRDLAFDTGVNHRAIYRHFPSKDTLMADAAERCWREFIRRMRIAIADQPAGEATLVAAGVAMFQYGRDNPNHFHFATGAYPSMGIKFPQLESAIRDALQIFAAGFAGTGLASDQVVGHAAIYISALHGIVSQYLHHRLRIRPENATFWITETCRMLVKGLR